MRVLFSPIRSDDTVKYELQNNMVTITFNGRKEVYDFTDMPEGVLEDFETDFPYKFVVSASKEKGVLSIVLLNFIGKNATDKERFPDWIEV
ncbi:hypothetical protein [Sutcliffiella cohnii]|uniref:hypothetical protein n=1 Tax=Sutcliffiella cohnii TaxID=33932 RepID=UPI002E23859A|nr:hypothetical protein [Sutcliffiella cohnii]